MHSPELFPALHRSSLIATCWTAVWHARPAIATTQCSDVNTQVQLDIAIPVTIHGRLCVPSNADPNTVQLLIHGGTYNGTYWDFPYQPQTYSYVQSANSAGFTTFNIDRVGYGQSTRPLSATITGLAQTSTVHQLVTKLHNGAIGGTAFSKVVLVGHSLGSAIAALEAAAYHDVQGVVLSGMTHHLSPTQLLQAFTQYMHPAILDPQFADSGIDAGYLTTIPGKRQAFFYSPDNADPGVVATDEETKDLLSTTEFDDIVTGFEVPTSLAINVPVFEAVGSEDALFCTGVLASDCSSAAALKAEEASAFSAAAQLHTYVLPSSGHDVGLAENTADFRSAVFSWQRGFIGS